MRGRLTSQQKSTRSEKPIAAICAPLVLQQISMGLLQRELHASVVLLHEGLDPCLRTEEPFLHVLHVQRTLAKRDRDTVLKQQLKPQQKSRAARLAIAPLVCLLQVLLHFGKVLLQLHLCLLQGCSCNSFCSPQRYIQPLA